MRVLKTTSQLAREIAAEVEAFDPEEVEDIGEWMRDNLLPLIESTATAVDELAQETAAGFHETAEVLAEVLDGDDDDEDDGYLIPAELTRAVNDVLTLGAGIIRALIDKTPLEALEGQITAYDVGGKELIEKMAELTEDDDDDDEEDDPADDGAIEGDADDTGDIEE